MPDTVAALNEIAARWEHGHPEPTGGCAGPRRTRCCTARLDRHCRR